MGPPASLRETLREGYRELREALRAGHTSSRFRSTTYIALTFVDVLSVRANKRCGVETFRRLLELLREQMSAA